MLSCFSRERTGDLYLYIVVQLPSRVQLCDLMDCCCCQVTSSCLTLCDPIDSSPPGSSVPGILQARILERVAISFSNAWKWKVKVKSLSHIQLCTTPWTVTYQAPLSVGFSRQEYWSGLPCLSPACQNSLFFTISWSLLKLTSIESVVPSNHLILCHPLLLLPSVIPSIRVFSN